MHLAQDGRQRGAILRVGGRDRAFDRQAERVDGDMALAALDLLGGVEAARPAASVVLTDWLSTTTAVGAASRPSASRALITSTLTIGVHNPLSRQA